MKNLTLIVIFILLLFACSIGPNYTKPKLNMPTGWQENQATIESKKEIDKQWWKNFQDVSLNNLVDKALSNNLDIKIAATRIQQARAERSGVIANQLPDVNLSGSATRGKNSKNSYPPDFNGRIYNTFQTGFDASWELNIFGAKRAIEAANASLEATEELAHDTTVSLLGDVASNYIAIRNYQDQIIVAEENLTAQRDTLELIKSQKDAGLMSEIDVMRAAALVNSTESDIPILKASMKESLHSLEILLAEQPGTLDSLLSEKAKVPVSEKELVLGAPADIIRNRPDIREAERNLAAATATKGVIIAEMFPKISLASFFGLASSSTSNLLQFPSKAWNTGANGVLPILDFGRLRADINIASSLQEQAFLTYQKTVLNGLKEVENGLVAYYEEKKRMESLRKTAKEQKLATKLITERYRTGGLISFLDVLDAEKSLYSAEIALAQSKASLSTDLVVLYKALGGGWQETTIQIK